MEGFDGTDNTDNAEAHKLCELFIDNRIVTLLEEAPKDFDPAALRSYLHDAYDDRLFRHAEVVQKLINSREGTLVPLVAMQYGYDESHPAVDAFLDINLPVSDEEIERYVDLANKHYTSKEFVKTELSNLRAQALLYEYGLGKSARAFFEGRFRALFGRALSSLDIQLPEHLRVAYDKHRPEFQEIEDGFSELVDHVFDALYEYDRDELVRTGVDSRLAGKYVHGRRQEDEARNAEVRRIQKAAFEAFLKEFRDPAEFLHLMLGLKDGKLPPELTKKWSPIEETNNQ